MPILAIPFTPADGLRVQVQITLGRPELLRRRQARLPIRSRFQFSPSSIPGAERTCVDPSVVTGLGLPTSGPGFVLAPGASSGSPVFGGASFSFTYEAGLVILRPTTQPPSNLVIEELEVDELPLAAFGIEAVIGRDVLASCVPVYNGPAGSATPAY